MLTYENMNTFGFLLGKVKGAHVVHHVHYFFERRGIGGTLSIPVET